VIVHAIKADVDVDRARRAAEPSRRIVLTKASTIKPRPVRWLWLERVAAGVLSLLAGREGLGKSTVAYTVLADITRGRLQGIYYGQPRDALVAATEDSWEFTIVPRLMAADADLARVHRVDVQTADLADGGLSLPRDLRGLETAADDVGAVVLLLDPLLSRLDAGLDSHKDAEVRRALEPLGAFADRTGISVIGIIHVNKSGNTDPLSTLMGSRAFAAVARSVLFVAADPDNEEVRLLGVPKTNLGRPNLPTLAFSIEEAKVADSPEGPVLTGRLVWQGESGRTVREAIEAATLASGDKTATSEAIDWLRDYLAAHDGTVDSAAVKREGSKAGHSTSALQRARQRLHLVKTTSGFPRRSFWSQSSHQQGRHTTEMNEMNGTTESQSSQSCQSLQSFKAREDETNVDNRI